MRQLRIAQVAPLYERVPPALYGGTERVVSYLTEELVRQGHPVILFASGDSVTRAHLVSVWDKALRLDDRRRGAHGRVVDDIPAAVRAVDQMASWDRAACRATFEHRFTAERMARDYCQLYEALRRRTWRLSS